MKFLMLLALSSLVMACSKHNSGGGGEPGFLIAGHKVVDADFAGNPGQFGKRWKSKSCTAQAGKFTFICTTEFEVTQAVEIGVDGMYRVGDQGSYFSVSPMPIAGNKIVDESDRTTELGRIGESAVTFTLENQGTFSGKLISQTQMAFRYTDVNGSTLEGVAEARN